MSIIGPEIKETGRSGLLNWVLNESGEVLTGYTNAKWNGITTLELAKVIDHAINMDDVYPNRYQGIFHPVNETVTKYKLLCLINEVYGLNKTIEQGEAPKTVDKTLQCTRPYFNVPPLKIQLQELYEWSLKN